MKALNINIVYTFVKPRKDGKNCKVYLSFNCENLCVYLFKGMIQANEYTHLISICREQVLNYLDKQASDFNEINFNTIDF